jgi:glucose/arabinose dehydrogenase
MGRTSRRWPLPIVVLAAFAVACGSTGPSGSNTPGASKPSSSAPAGPSATGSTASTPAPAGSARPSSSAGASAGAFDPARVTVRLDPFVGGLDKPLAIVNAGDGSGRLFVAEQGGTVRIIRDGGLVPRPFVDPTAKISWGGERGLLGLAFAPDYPSDPRVFVDYTDRDGNTVVSALRVDPSDPDRLDASTELPILHVDQPFPNHNGGALAFTPDGFLLVSLGDGGGGGDPLGNGQSTMTLLAKILRLDVRNSSAEHPYAIPPGNPFADGSAGRPEIWLMGLRNPWRLSLDRATGDLWIGDVGQGAWEEIDVQRAGAPGGTNFGWNRMEGRHCYAPKTECNEPSLTLPMTDYGHDQGCTVIGGYVDRSATPSPLSGGYLFGDFCSGRLWAIDPATDAPRDPTVVGESGANLSAFGEDESGALYAADIAGGELLRVVATGR